jgi:hypothetical protein
MQIFLTSAHHYFAASRRVISISRLVTMRVFADRLVGCRHQSHKWEFCPRKQLSSEKNFFLSVNCLTLLDRFLNDAA